MSTVTPLKNKIIIGEVVKSKQTASGIVVKGNIDAEVRLAKVIAVGPDVIEVKVDDYVIPEWHKAKPVMIDGMQRAVILEDDIIGIVDKE
jgi:chaperonin GroES